MASPIQPYLEGACRRVIELAHSLPERLSNTKVREDTKLALVGGVFLGLCIILILAAFPGKPFDYSLREQEDESSSGQEAQRRPLVGSSAGEIVEVAGADAGPTVEDILADEDKLMSSQKLDRARQMLGLSEDQVRQAIRQARDDVKSGKAGRGGTDSLYEHGSLSGKVDVVFYVVAFGALFYFLERDYGNLASQWFRQMFPREAAVLFGPGADEL